MSRYRRGVLDDDTGALFATLFTGHDPAGGWGNEVFESSRVDSDVVRRCSFYRESGRIGGGFHTLRVVSGYDDPTRSAKSDPTGEKPLGLFVAAYD